MEWNVSAEVIAFIIVLIISVYSRKSHAVPSPKNRVFRLCLATTLGAIGTNLASTLMIAYAPPELLPLTYLITLCYFALTPLLGTVYFYYAVAVVSEARPVGRRFAVASCVPCAAYFLLVVANVPTGCLFFFDAAGSYVQGPLIVTTYLVFYFYCVACFALVVFTRAPIDPVIKRILAVFPLIAVGVIAVQQLFPAYLLSGSAAACSLLIIYLYLQNKRLSVDQLTGASNRQEFLSMVSLLDEKAQPFTAVLVSLSNFKFINDKFGHESGDRFLREFASYLGTIDDARLFRYSGDQFAFIMSDGVLGTRGEDGKTAALLAPLRQRLSEPWRIGGRSYTVGAAIGAVSYPAIAHNPGDVVAALEYATVESKGRGPNVPCVCTPDMMEAIHRRSAIADVVRRAAECGGFTVKLQPVWSESERRFVAAEALCRLDDDELGSIPPDEFIPVAEQIGVISDVTRFMLNRACAFIRTYRDAHPDSTFRGVSVNFSAVEFIQDDLAESVLAVVERHGIPASCLRVEVTESAIIANPDAVRAFMEDMHAHGVRFYLDDFGTGYSNISMMLELPFDVVKLDKSILWSATEDEHLTEFFGLLTAGFGAMGSQILSEGVETQEQRGFLNECGCSLMQGYLFSRPLSPDEAAAVIAASEEEAR
ncbi:putative bifunctional diguanylate cyclase/phosphodiesterase [Gordonibacter massiliensis (ex Traore et al. 2017)]|uniref:EAL domain-containing protein n=1 Tax=Gordonibacter massiliensis (ex Traore et al. 2017) TaxID=1841863 RepID=A0A842JK31_9ACTN|nr:bifunctional diguanylate cyclase/phosphodiesterase [Gordonibacter massiliensis (ex Traore et al. 2017)]MBC2889450.1 EAL domain-containing protein [Gordonibacter massiliensis (ex Traore et al. 2017)]